MLQSIANALQQCLEFFCVLSECAWKISEGDSKLFPVLRLSPTVLQDPRCPAQTFHHFLPIPKKTSQTATWRKKRYCNLDDGLLISVFTTAIKPLMIRKLVLANTLGFDPGANSATSVEACHDKKQRNLFASIAPAANSSLSMDEAFSSGMNPWP